MASGVGAAARRRGLLGIDQGRGDSGHHGDVLVLVMTGQTDDQRYRVVGLVAELHRRGQAHPAQAGLQHGLGRAGVRERETRGDDDVRAIFSTVSII